MRRFRSHGDGHFELNAFRMLGHNAIIEEGVRAWHPENIEIGENVYIGHDAKLKAYHENHLIIENNVWIGQNVFLHAAGGIKIGSDVGIGPGVMILTSAHQIPTMGQEILDQPIETAPVEIGRGCDLGAGSILLKGVSLGVGVQVGAGSVVTRSVPDGAIVAGNPARVLRFRDGADVNRA